MAILELKVIICDMWSIPLRSRSMAILAIRDLRIKWSVSQPFQTIIVRTYEDGQFYFGNDLINIATGLIAMSTSTCFA